MRHVVHDGAEQVERASVRAALRDVPPESLLRALGLSTQQLLDFYYEKESIHLEDDGTVTRAVDFELLSGQRASHDIRDPETGETVVKKGKKFRDRKSTRLNSSH